MASGFGIGVVGLGSAQSIYRGLQGHPDLVSFIDPVSGGTLVQMDAVLSENHSSEAKGTEFPIETGASISDHIVIAPFEIQLQCLITDSPIGNRESYKTEGEIVAASAVLPALGVATAATAYALHSAQDGTTSRSKAAFVDLTRLQRGSPTTFPPTPPKVFDVVTKLRRYESMYIKQLSVPRDPSISNAILFQVTLGQLIIVQAQSSNVQFVSNKGLAALKNDEAEKEAAKRNGAEAGYNAEQGSRFHGGAIVVKNAVGG